jgi:hypothetical protein
MSVAARVFYRLNTWQINAGVVVLSIFYASVAGLLGTAFLAPAFGWGHGAQAAVEDADTLAGRFARWDSGYYLQIAANGYRPNGAERAFFPLYPLLVRALSMSSGLSILWSGWIISVVCFILAGLLLYHWVHTEYNPATARWCLIWFSLFPVSFFYISFYPESLFLLTSIASLFFARRGRFVASGICIALAGLARPTAFLLAVPYFVEFALQGKFQWSRWLSLATGALVAPLGTVGYFLFLAAQAGSSDPVGVYTSNLALHWHRATVWPWMTFQYAFAAALFGEGIGSDWFSKAVVWHDLLYALFGSALALWAFPRLPRSLSWLFVAGMLFFLTSKGPYGYVFDGMPRHVASIVPVYMALALVMQHIPAALRWMAVSLSVILLGLLSAWFASGRWVT